MARPCWYPLVAFSGDAVASILALSKGDSLSVTGRAKLTEWAGQDGVEKRGLSVVTDQVLIVYQIEKKRRQAVPGHSARRVATKTPRVAGVGQFA